MRCHRPVRLDATTSRGSCWLACQGGGSTLTARVVVMPSCLRLPGVPASVPVKDGGTMTPRIYIYLGDLSSAGGSRSRSVRALPPAWGGHRVCGSRRPAERTVRGFGYVQMPHDGVARALSPDWMGTGSTIAPSASGSLTYRAAARPVTHKEARCGPSGLSDQSPALARIVVGLSLLWTDR